MRDEHMGEAIVYDAYLERRADGSALAHVLDLPGCSALGASEAEALDRLAARLAPHYAWLRRHDEYTPLVQGPARVVVREVVHVGSAGQRGGAFFTLDAVPVTGEDLDWYLALLDWAYTDLYATTQARQHDGVGPDRQSAQSVLQRAAQEQLWLLSRLEERPTMPHFEVPPGNMLDLLRHVWQASLARGRATTHEERSRVVEHDGERWSQRKVQRRSIYTILWAENFLTRSSDYA